jgi:hypothetical protein
LATVQALATQTLHTVSAEEKQAFIARLHALADAHDLAAFVRYQPQAERRRVGRCCQIGSNTEYVDGRPRGHRFGAGVSAILLIVAFVANLPWVVPFVLLSIGISAAFGLRYSIYGAIWRRIVRVAHLGPAEPEHEYPPRFAQVLGSTALVLSLIAFGLGVPVLGWVFALAVAALQTLLAVTGYCLGCRLYFLRWWVPDFVTRIWTRGRRPAGGSLVGSKINFR